MPATPRLGIPYPVGSDPADVPTDLSELVAPLDNLVLWGKGTFASRPVSTIGSPGIGGRVYIVQDPGNANDGHVFFDHGTGWIDLGPFSAAGIGPDTITAVELAPNAVTAAELADGAVDTTAIADAVITLAKLAATLKPSTGAGASAEALRAIGTDPGEVAPGLHASQHDPFGVDPLNWATNVALYSPTRRLTSQPITSDVVVNSSNVNSPSPIVTAPAISLDGSTKVIIELSVPSIEITAGGSTTLNLVLWGSLNGGTDTMIGIMDRLSMQQGFFYGPATISYEFPVAPAAGNWVYRVAAFFLAGGCSGTIKAGNGGNTVNAFLQGMLRILRT